eukprot:TRINITY_DN2748_c0_g1_i4.p1 TRINITY_DN2748_c0_g1~~TRINITY_DN2748_c0_g1_i4.p1  ORF type:complete len:151 (-),score=44.81 TRINITY_DN2748_c0_g1_i4:447-899(-)
MNTSIPKFEEVASNQRFTEAFNAKIKFKGKEKEEALEGGGVWADSSTQSDHPFPSPVLPRHQVWGSDAAERWLGESTMPTSKARSKAGGGGGSSGTGYTDEFQKVAEQDAHVPPFPAPTLGRMDEEEEDDELPRRPSQKAKRERSRCAVQ